MTEFAPRFAPKEVATLAAAYVTQSRPQETEREYRIIAEIAPTARARGYFTREDLKEICRWKSPRSAARAEINSEEFVHATTAVALSTPSERLRVEVLTLLDGVKWPTASVLLHFGAADPCRKGESVYPILDFRALDSLQVSTPRQYHFAFWREYTEFCRDLARRWDVDMRTLDRALWQHSKIRSEAR